VSAGQQSSDLPDQMYDARFEQFLFPTTEQPRLHHLAFFIQFGWNFETLPLLIAESCQRHPQANEQELNAEEWDCDEVPSPADQKERAIVSDGQSQPRFRLNIEGCMETLRIFGDHSWGTQSVPELERMDPQALIQKFIDDAIFHGKVGAGEFVVFENSSTLDLQEPVQRFVRENHRVPLEVVGCFNEDIRIPFFTTTQLCIRERTGVCITVVYYLSWGLRRGFDPMALYARREEEEVDFFGWNGVADVEKISSDSEEFQFCCYEILSIRYET
jgi:hypothetical protein